MLIEQDFLSSLQSIRLALKGISHSFRVGVHPLPRFGRSTEFLGYREYTSGDDLKDLDWKVFAKTDRMYIRQKSVHVPATFLIVVDNSMSMALQSEHATISKYQAALTLAFALGFILHSQGDAFAFSVLSTTEDTVAEPRFSKKAFDQFLRQLNELEKQGCNSQELQFPILRPKQFSHVFYISDFLITEAKWKKILQRMVTNSLASTIVCIQDPEEYTPIAEKKEMYDLESPTLKKSVSSLEWEKYLQNYTKHHQDIQKYCTTHSIQYQKIDTIESIVQSIQNLFQQISE